MAGSTALHIADPQCMTAEQASACDAGGVHRVFQADVEGSPQRGDDGGGNGCHLLPERILAAENVGSRPQHQQGGAYVELSIGAADDSESGHV